MNNNDLVEKVAAATGLSKTDTKKVVDAVVTTMADAAAAGEEVSLHGFGKFKVKDIAARQGRNPKTGEPVAIAASKKLAFSVSQTMKNRLNG